MYLLNLAFTDIGTILIGDSNFDENNPDYSENFLKPYPVKCSSCGSNIPGLSESSCVTPGSS